MTNQTIIREANINDFNYIESLRRKNSSALGFIPKNVYLSILQKKRIDNRDRWWYSKIWVTEDNRDLTGFCYVSFANDPVNIFQVVIQEDARRWHRACMLENKVFQESLKNGFTKIKCRVAYDLDANFYWKALGYKPIITKISTWLNQKESKTKRQIILYEKKIKQNIKQLSLL